MPNSREKSYLLFTPFAETQHKWYGFWFESQKIGTIEVNIWRKSRTKKSKNCNKNDLAENALTLRPGKWQVNF